MKKIKTTFRIPKSVKKEMIETMVADNYGLRGKSKWIEEAINDLLTLDHYQELVEIGQDLNSFEDSDSIYLSEAIKSKLDDGIIQVRKVFPTIEGVQSIIIRTSIIQRLLRKSRNQSPVTGKNVSY